MNLHAQRAAQFCDNARYFSHLRTERGLQSALYFYDQALAVDPRCAQAYAGKAACYVMIADAAYMMPPMPLFRALDFANKALALEASHEAYAARAKALIGLRYAWNEADELLARALELAPTSHGLHLARACTSLLQGNFERALSQARGTIGLAIANVFARRYGEAIPMLEPIAADGQAQWDARILLGLAYFFTGRQDAAIDLWERVRSSSSASNPTVQPCHRSRALGYLLFAYGTLARHGEHNTLRAQLDGSRHTRYVPPMCYALDHIGLREYDLAQSALEQSLSLRDPWTALLLIEPVLDPLRGHPQFEAIAVQVRLGTELPPRPGK